VIAPKSSRAPSSLPPDWHERVQEWVERTCAEQGVPVKVTDRRVVREVAAILRSAREERASGGR
jgi:hypothetical protein